MELNFEHALLIVDCENLFRSAQTIYGQQSRIDYKKLTNFMMLGKSVKVFHKLAFVSLKPEQSTQMDFLSFLDSLGYTVRYSLCVVSDEDPKNIAKSKDYFLWLENEISRFTCGKDEYPGIVSIACGSQKLLPLYRTLLYFGVHLEVLGISGALSGYLQGVTKRTLDANVLIG